MSGLKITLFVRLKIETDDGKTITLPGRKVEELLCFLLLNRRQPLNRESLADTLWPDAAGDLGRNYLRKALWQLQRALTKQVTGPAQTPNSATSLRTGPETANQIDWLVIEPKWISIRPQAGLVLDVARFESAYQAAYNISGRDLAPETAAALQEAETLYLGDLMEGWYSEWLLVERERLQLFYMIMLEKLMSYSEAHGELEAGLAYGFNILRLDPAHERTHRMLIRFYLSSGRPAEAARQYELCTTILNQELGIAPSEKTNAIYQEFHRGRNTLTPGELDPVQSEDRSDISARLDALQVMLKQAEREIRTLRSLFV